MQDFYDLTKRDCIPCKGDIPPLKGEALQKLIRSLGNGWEVIDEKRLEKTFRFKDFKEALAFTNKVGACAEKEGHHPDIYLTWGQVKIALWTHKIGGLSDNDFILAAKIITLLQ